MVLMKWDMTFSVGVKKIDEQHQRLVDMLNQLFDLMKTGEGKSALGPVLNDLIAYAATHFKTEEEYFDKFKYAETETHKAEHKQFVDKVVAFQTDFKKGNTMLTVEVMNFLRDWLVKHIKGTDKRYTKCFNEHDLF